jgi:uncharacterized repeat protein (TIGR04076 family)
MVKIHNVKITVLRRFHPSEVFKTAPAKSKTTFGKCEMLEDGQEFTVENMSIPKGFCNTAWLSIYNNVRLLSFGFDLPWFEEKGVAVNSCTDGFRPVVFKLERI